MEKCLSTDVDKDVFKQGRKAFHREVSQCPFDKDHEKTYSWWLGWLEARAESKLKHVFDKHGLEYP